MQGLATALGLWPEIQAVELGRNRLGPLVCPRVSLTARRRDNFAPPNTGLHAMEGDGRNQYSQVLAVNVTEAI